MSETRRFRFFVIALLSGIWTVLFLVLFELQDLLDLLQECARLGEK